MLNDVRELQRIYAVAGNGERLQSILKSTPRQASHHRVNALTAKNTGEQVLIYGSGLSVTLKTLLNQP